MNKRIKEILVIHIIILLVALISSVLNIRICPIYNIFHIPCVGCGLTRGFMNILEGKIWIAMQYNVLSIILVAVYIIVIIWSIYDKCNKKVTLKKWTNKNKKKLTIISIIIFVVVWIINIRNPILY